MMKKSILLVSSVLLCLCIVFTTQVTVNQVHSDIQLDVIFDRTDMIKIDYISQEAVQVSRQLNHVKDMISKLKQSSEKTNDIMWYEELHDVPNYIKLRINDERTIYMYHKNNSYYLAIPYQPIFEIDQSAYKFLENLKNE